MKSLVVLALSVSLVYSPYSFASPEKDLLREIKALSSDYEGEDYQEVFQELMESYEKEASEQGRVERLQKAIEDDFIKRFGPNRGPKKAAGFIDQVKKAFPMLQKLGQKQIDGVKYSEADAKELGEFLRGTMVAWTGSAADAKKCMKIAYYSAMGVGLLLQVLNPFKLQYMQRALLAAAAGLGIQLIAKEYICE
jgi:hypothetical protein